MDPDYIFGSSLKELSDQLHVLNKFVIDQLYLVNEHSLVSFTCMN